MSLISKSLSVSATPSATFLVEENLLQNDSHGKDIIKVKVIYSFTNLWLSLFLSFRFFYTDFHEREGDGLEDVPKEVRLNYRSFHKRIPRGKSVDVGVYWGK